MNSCLITGCNGFIGSNLASYLLEKGLTVSGTIHHQQNRIYHKNRRIALFNCDILIKNQIKDTIQKTKPNVIIHLAAQSKVVPSWINPELTLKINLMGTLNLLEAVRENSSSMPLVIVVEAAAIYGSSTAKENINETHELSPSSPYAVSKIAQDYLARLYYSAYNLRIIRVRPFNITGPGNMGDACSDFASAIAEIEKGRLDVLRIGDLNSVRDITDIRDAVRAFWQLIQKGSVGDVYNLCSGNGYVMQNILDKLLSLSTIHPTIVNDTSKNRVLIDNFQIGDNSLLRGIGWTPTIPIEITLQDMLNYCRAN